MTTPTSTAFEPQIEYPDDDGLPMSDNTLQFRWIVTIQGNLDGMYYDDPNVFVAGNLLWYPVEGQPAVRMAPDALVAFGRHKGYRGSYMQWREGGIAPQVVFEVRSPNNTPDEMDRKLEFYDRYGVEEYYLYDPDAVELSGWLRKRKALRPIPVMDGWVSPRLSIRFDLSGDELVIYLPDGERFLTFVELKQQQEQDRGAKQQAEQEAKRAKRAAKRAEQAAKRAEQERELAQRQVEQERQTREEAQRRAERLAERLRALGLDPDAGPPA